LVRRREERAGVAHLNAARAEGAEMQPDGGGAGATVEGKSDGALGEVGDVVAGVGDEEEAGLGGAVLLLEEDGAGGGGGIDILAADAGGVFGLRALFFGRRRGLLFFFGLFGLGSILRADREGSERSGKQNCDEPADEMSHGRSLLLLTQGGSVSRGVRRCKRNAAQCFQSGAEVK